MLASIVQKQIEIKSAKDDDTEPTCLIDIMLESEVYQGNPAKIVNDLVIGMLAGTDTSRNTVITTLSYLT